MEKLLLKLLIVFFIGFNSVVKAQQVETPTYITTVEGIKEYRLKNGLQVLLLPDQSQSNMIVNIVYLVGSKHEGYGEKGMAHLLEHMLFKSTKNLGDIKTMLSEKGGQANGTTWYDRTNYYEVFPYSEERLRWSIEMEADRMINATLLQEDLDTEFSVVRNEFEIGENDPTSVLLERIVSTAYLWHNYGNSTIGSKEDIERVTVAQLRRFYEKYYQPDNAVLIIGGKFEEEKALKYIGDYFGKIPKPKRTLDQILTVEPPQDGEKIIEVKRHGDSQSFGAMYHTASFSDKDYAVLSVLQQILTMDPSGYLYKALVNNQTVSQIWAFQPQVRDAGYLYFGADINKTKDIKQTSELIRNELDKIAHIDYTAEDVERAKARLIKNIENRQNNTLQLAQSLTEAVSSGDYRLGFIHRDRIENVTKDDVKRVAERYFRANNRTIGVFIPTTDEIRVRPDELSNKALSELTINYEGRSAEKEAKPFEASIANLKKHYSHVKLKNGAKLGLINKEIKGEKVIISMSIPVSNEQQLASKQHIGSLTAQLLMAGTKKLSKEQIKDQLDALKSTVSFNFTRQTLSVNIQTYKNTLEQTMHLVGQIIREPIFPKEELDKMVHQRITAYEEQLNDPRSLAFNEINRMASPYPRTSLYYTPTFEEMIDQLKTVKQADLMNFYQSILGAQHGVISVIGTNEIKPLITLFNKSFGQWNSPSMYVKAYPTLIPTKKVDEIKQVADKENAAAIGRINFKLNQDHVDYPALLMANEIFGSGGFLSARLPQRLREKEGISYGAGAFMSASQDKNNQAGSWSFYAFLNPSKRAAVENAVKDEITKALTDGFTEKELASNLESWKVSRKTALGNDSRLLSLSNTFLLLGVSFDEFDLLEKKMEKLTLKQVNDVFKKYIQLDQLCSFYVGTF